MRIVQGIFLPLVILCSITAQEQPPVPDEFTSIAKGEEFLFQKRFRLENGDELQVGFFLSQALERIRAVVFKAGIFMETISPRASLLRGEDIVCLKTNLASIEKSASAYNNTLWLRHEYFTCAFPLSEDSMPLSRFFDAFEKAMLKKNPEWGRSFAYSGFRPAGLLKTHRIIFVSSKITEPDFGTRYLVGLDGSVFELNPERLLTAYRMENMRFPKPKDISDMFDDFIRQLHDGHGKMVSDVRAIPHYFDRRLPEDLEMAVRPPWSYNGGGGKCHVFYVYESMFDRVIRYVITLSSDGTPSDVNEIVLGSTGHTKIYI